MQVGAVQVLTSADAARDLEPEWDALAVAQGRTPFALPAMALSWWEHLGQGELLVVAVRGRSGELLAVGPFHLRRLGGLRIARWVGTGLGTVAEVLSRPDVPAATDAVWDAVAERAQVLDLSECRDDGAGLLELRRSPRWRTDLRVVDLCPTLDLSSLSSVDELLADRSNLRKKLRRYDRAIDGNGSSFAVEVVTEPAHFARVLPEVRAVCDEAEAAQPRQHLFRGLYQPFAEQALQTAAERQQLVAFVGRLGGRAVAFDVAVRIGDTLADWVGRYRPDVADLSVGHLVLRDVVGWSLANGIRTIDLLVGDHEYKRRWSSGHYDTVDITGSHGPWRAPAGMLLQGVHALHPARQALRAARARWGDRRERGGEPTL